jgi:hypothetical protein
MAALEDIEDSTNLTGLSSLVNKFHTDEKLDLDKLEKSMIGNIGIRIIAESDPAKEFESTIRELSVNTGINLDGTGVNIPDTPKKVKPQNIEENLDDILDEPETDNYESSSEEEYESDDNHSNSDYEVYKSHNNSKKYKKENYSYHPYNSYDTRVERIRDPYYNRPVQDRYNIREEEQLDEVLQAYSGTHSDVNIEREKEEDMKAILIGDIEELKEELASDGVDLSRIPEVNQDSPIKLVKNVHKSLRVKYDRKRCNTLGSEIILAGAQGLGYVFDGKRKFGPFSPNLDGWSNTVRPKLRKMRYETSSIVAGIMQEYNIGPGPRILLELVPSAFLYSNMRKEQHEKTGYSPTQMSAAFDELREFDQND